MLLKEAEGVCYELFTLAALRETAEMAADAFARHEPITSTLGISPENFCDFIKLLGPKAEQEQLTVIARDSQSGRVIGAMISDDFAIAPPEQIKCLGAKFEPIWAILDDLDSRYLQGRRIEPGQFLHFFLLAVEQRYSGNHVGWHLVQTGLDNGIRKGYKTGIVEATSVVSQRIFRKSGFVDRYQAAYKTFAFQGRRPLESIDAHHGIILMDKTLTAAPAMHPAPITLPG